MLQPSWLRRSLGRRSLQKLAESSRCGSKSAASFRSTSTLAQIYPKCSIISPCRSSNGTSLRVPCSRISAIHGQRTYARHEQSWDGRKCDDRVYAHMAPISIKSNIDSRTAERAHWVTWRAPLPLAPSGGLTGAAFRLSVSCTLMAPMSVTSWLCTACRGPAATAPSRTSAPSQLAV